MGANAQETLSILENLYAILKYIYEILSPILELTKIGIAGISLIVTVVSAVVTTVIALIFWALKAYPVYKLAKKLNYKYAILAWMPILGDVFRNYVLATMVGDKPFTMFGGKITIQNRTYSFLICLGIYLFGTPLITALIGILNVLPGIGQILGVVTSLLYLLPAVALVMMNIVYINDIADRFDADKQANRNAAILVSILDAIGTHGLAETVYMYILARKDPLPQEICEAE